MSALELLYRLAVLRRVSDRPGPFDPKQVRKILVVRADNIGDVVCTTPALDALRAAFPQARIAALVCTLAQDAISGHRALDQLYSYPKTKHKQYGLVRSFWMLGQTLAAIRRENYDLAVSFRADFSTSQGWLAYASRARWRLGVGAVGKRRRWGFFYNLPAPAIPAGLHEVERCFNLLGLIQVDSSSKRLYLKVPRPAAERVERFLLDSGLEEGARPLVLNVTRWAYRPDRLWPPERYRRLATAARSAVV